MEAARPVRRCGPGNQTDRKVDTAPRPDPYRAHHRGRFNIDINPADGLVRFTRPGGGVILGRATTPGAAPMTFPVEPGTLPTRWDGSPLRVTELTPPPQEHTAPTAPTALRFASPELPEATAARLAPTLRCRFEHEGDVWVTSAPDLITVTPNPAGAGSLVTIELTTHPHQLTTTLTAIGLTVAHADVPHSPGGDDG